MPAMSVGGLASGLDTNNIIAQLTALEQAKVTREIQKKTNAQSTMDKFKELETKLLSLQTKAKGLELPKDFNLFKSTSNYEEYATVSGGEGATAGQYELVVKQLATTLKVASNSFSAVNKSMDDLEMMGKDDSPITVSLSTSKAAQKTDGKKSVDIVINSSDTLKDIVNKINAAEGAGVKASIMSMSNGDNRIVLTAVDSGTDAFSIKENGGTKLFEKLGIVDYTDQKATSAGALTVLGGGRATEETYFTQLNTALDKNNFYKGSASNNYEDCDKLGIYLPKDNGSGDKGWVTFDLFNSDGSSKQIKDVLAKINTALEATNADFTASLNDSGEIVLEGKLNDDQNFGNLWLSEVKIQMGTFDETQQKFTAVKKDMGTLSDRSIFNENNIITKAQNAFYTIDGMAVSSQSNDDDKTISGTIFNLKKADPDKVIKVTLESDMSAIADKISEFVEEFNALLKFIDENAKASVVEETDKATGKKVNNRVVGAFTGDSGISGLRESLRSMFSGIINEITGSLGNADKNKTNYSSASRVGIVANREGYYDIDKEKLTKALNTDFEGVRKLFTSGGFSEPPGFSIGRFTKDSEAGVYEYNSANLKWTLNGKEIEGTWVGNNIFTTKNGLSIELPAGAGDAKVTFVRGIAGQLSTFVEKAKTGYYNQKDEWVDGFIKQSKDKYQNRIDEIQKRVDQLQTRVDNYENRLIKQFTALEKSMSSLQSQSANMLSALSSLNTNSKK
jgi:flagellar hook-associated protein 2